MYMIFERLIQFANANELFLSVLYRVLQTG